MDFFIALGMILLINIVLSGDNAVVIAMASRTLPLAQRKKAIFWGSALAVVLRIILVVVATYLLRVPYLQFVGGLALVYIAFHLLSGDDGEEGDEEPEAADSFIGAIRVILLADLIMSLDNVLAIAGVAKWDWLILVIGLSISVPLVVCGAQFLSVLMNKFPIIAYVGAGLITWTAVEMICNDKMVSAYLEHYGLIIKIAVTNLVLAFGYWRKSRVRKEAGQEADKEAEKETASV